MSSDLATVHFWGAFPEAYLVKMSVSVGENREEPSRSQRVPPKQRDRAANWLGSSQPAHLGPLPQGLPEGGLLRE